MMVRHSISLLTKVMLALVAGTAMTALASAADLPLRPQKQALPQNYENTTVPTVKPASKPASKPAGQSAKKSTTPADDITGSIRWPANMRANLPPATAAISHTFAARATFDKARAAMDLGILLLDDAPKGNLPALQAAVANLDAELDALAQLPQNQSNTAIKGTKGLVKDWYDAGLKIIKPPPQGIRELPFPVSVDSKASVVAQALDQLISDASAPRRN
jgi:hypothetical protein